MRVDQVMLDTVERDQSNVLIDAKVIKCCTASNI